MLCFIRLGLIGYKNSFFVSIAIKKCTQQTGSYCACLRETFQQFFPDILYR
mgnify:CR=1 FL=1